MATLNVAPVFADPTGRRGRVIRACAYLAALAAVGFLVAVVVVLTAAPKTPHVSKKAWRPQNTVVGAPVPASAQGGGAHP